MITFERFDANKMNEYTDALIHVDGEHRGMLTRVTGEPPFGCPVIAYIVEIVGKEPRTFRITSDTSAQKALHEAKKWARTALGETRRIVKYPVRIMMCMDVNAETPAEAYRILTTAIAKLCTENPDLDWESGDEWYGTDGEPLSAEDIGAARAVTFRAAEDADGYETERLLRESTAEDEK